MSSLARREYKFLIDEAMVDRVRELIAGYCESDEHAKATAGRYVCDTLYCDSHRFDLYRATIENAGVRHKVRMRAYPHAPNSPVFLEIKRRVEETIVKTRVGIRGDWARVVEECLLDGVPPRDHAAAENFFAQYHSARIGMIVPQVMVRYEREPFSSLVDDYARVTFDREISYQPHSELSFATNSQWIAIDGPIEMWPVERSNVVMELKFHSVSPPHWMRRIVHGLELRRLAFCKYTRAVDSMLHRPEERIARFDYR